MGLFNTVICNYNPLGETFVGKELQTKEPDALFPSYWISPAGELYEPSYTGCYDAVDRELKEGEESSFFNLPYEWVPTGKHGKLRPCYYTGSMRIYPANHEGEWTDWPEAILLFKLGKIIDYTFQTPGDRL